MGKSFLTVSYLRGQRAGTGQSTQAAAQEPQQDVVHPVDETVTCAMMTDEIVTVTAIAVGILTKIEDLMTVTRTVHLIGAQIETKKGCKSVIEC